MTVILGSSVAFFLAGLVIAGPRAETRARVTKAPGDMNVRRAERGVQVTDRDRGAAPITDVGSAIVVGEKAIFQPCMTSNGADEQQLKSTMCAAATPLSGDVQAGFTTVFSNVDAATDPLCVSCEVTAGHDVWFEYVPAQSGSLMVDTCGTYSEEGGPDTMITVYKPIPSYRAGSRRPGTTLRLRLGARRSPGVLPESVTLRASQSL